jgi:hypothetical protein
VIDIPFLEWCRAKLHALGKRALFTVQDDASWHTSRTVQHWIREHNRHVRRSGQSVRILVCCLPVKGPWLNPIEPKWVRAKRRIVEPDRALSAHELADRVCETFDCDHEEHLSIPETVA